MQKWAWMLTTTDLHEWIKKLCLQKLAQVCHEKNWKRFHWKVAYRDFSEVQWLRIWLPMRRTWVWSLVWEDSMCHGVTKLVCQNYWAHAPQRLKPTCPRACIPQQEKTPKCETHASQWRVAPLDATRESPRTATKTQCSQKWINK